MRDIKLVALHKHWVTADSINHHVRRSMKVPLDFPEGMQKEIAEFSFQMSTFAALGVWYGLLQVVVEGYQELGCKDEAVAELLAQEEFARSFRRFRNATFHYQEDSLGPKLMEFLTAKDSEVWVRNLNVAFKQFFERELGIGEMVDRLREGA